VEYSLQEHRQIYFVQIEGISEINGTILNDSDAMEITDENSLLIKALKKSHFLFIEMNKI
jgi:redox-sensitive bicupin YhaK (pirin superfamily)